MAVDEKKVQEKQKEEIIDRTAPLGALGFWNSIGSYVLPAFIGNVIGGVALVAVRAHAEFFEAEAQST